MAGEFQFEMVFTADTSAVKPATNEVKSDIANVGNAADQTTQSLAKHTNALERDAAAAKKAADASRQQAQAEREARDALARTVVSGSAQQASSSQVTRPTMADAAYGQSAEELKAEMTAVSAIISQATSELDRHTASLQRATTATQHQVQAEKDLSAALGQQRIAPVAPAQPAQAPSQPQPNPLRQPSAPVPSPSTRSAPNSTPEDLERLKVAYLPLYAAQRNYEKALADIDALQKANSLSADEHTVAIAKAQKAFDNETATAQRAASALLGHKDAVKLTSFEVKNLGFQLNDTVQTLALGMPPLQVFMQQGPQAVQAVGGVGNALRLVGQVATGTNIAIAGTAAAVVGGALAWNSYLNSIKPVEIAAAGLGRAVAGSAGEMERSAQAGAAAGNVSVKSARAMEAQFLSTGRIGSENFEKLIASSKDFAATIGVDSDQAGAVLAQMFADPAKAAQTLYHQYGLIDGATAEYATRLANQNRLSEAQTVILDALPARLVRASEATTGWARIWDRLGTAAGNAYDKVGAAIDRGVTGPSIDSQIAQARQKLTLALNQKQSGSFGSWLASPVVNRDIASAQSTIDTLGPVRRRQQEQEALARARAQAEQAAANASSIAQQSPANADQLQRQNLADSIAALQSGGKQPTPELQNQVNEALKAKTTLLANLTDKQARLNEIDQLDIQIQNARDPLTRAELTYRQQILQLGLQEINQATAEAQAQRARGAVIQTAISAASSQAANMQDELNIRKKLDAQVAAGTMTSDQAQAKLQEELELRPLIAAADKANISDKRQLMEVITQLRSAYSGLAAEEERMAAINIARQSPANAPLEQQRSLQEEIKRLQADIAKGGQSDPTVTAEQNGALAEKQRVLGALANKQQILNDIDALGVRIQNEINPAIQAELTARQKRLQLSLQEGNAAEKEADVQRAYNEIINSTIAGAAKQASDMSFEIGIRQKLNAQVAAGTITSDDAQRKLQEELQLRPLIAAAANLEDEKKQALLKTIADLKAGYDGLAAAEKQAAGNDYLRGQQDKLETLRAQQSVVGQSEAAQARVNALVQAEQDIRSRGLDAAGQQAQMIRANAAAIADANTQLEKSKDAWNTYKQAGESAIDEIFSGDKPGDIGKKLANTFLDLGKQLIVTNPLKNMLLGTNYGTIGDLFSGKKAGGGILGGLGQSVATMNVTAANVMLNGGIGGGLNLFGTSPQTTGSIGQVLTAANGNGATGGVASYITQAALKRGIDPSVALNVAKSEGGLSSWNMQSSVFKNGVQEPSFGPFQLYTGGGLGNAFMNKTGLDPRVAANGPAGVDFALDYAKQNGWGSWYGAAKSGIGNFDGIGKVNTSLNQLSGSVSSAAGSVGGLTSATGTAANGLNTFGGGLDQFGNKLATSITGGGAAGSGGGLFGGLFGGIGKLFGFGGGGGGFNIGSNATPITGFNPLAAYANSGFDSGGYTGPGGKLEPAGVVHRGEFVFDAAATANAGVSNLDRLHRTLKGYADGGAVGRSVMSAPGRSPLSSMAAANGNAPGSVHRTEMNVSLNVDGANSKDAEAAGYAGMKRALDEYDQHVLPARVQEVNQNPRWR